MNELTPPPSSFDVDQDVYCSNQKSKPYNDGDEMDTSIYFTANFKEPHNCYIRQDVAASKGPYSRVSCDKNGCIPDEGTELRKEYESMMNQFKTEDTFMNILCCMICLGLIAFVIWNMTKTKTMF